MLFFFVDTSDGKRFIRDEVGLEVESLQAARADAVAALPAISQEGLADGNLREPIAIIRDPSSRVSCKWKGLTSMPKPVLDVPEAPIAPEGTLEGEGPKTPHILTRERLLFGYDSLIWNPTVHYVESRIASIEGWKRAFCLSTPAGRGTLEHPGLVLALDAGGSCTGVAFRIAEEVLMEELSIVWRREMLTGAYIPHWVPLRVVPPLVV